MEREKIISVKNLTKEFGHFTAVKGISFDVYKGEIGNDWRRERTKESRDSFTMKEHSVVNLFAL